ncbi:RIBOSOMAL RNA PROCESSING PROTEIN 1 [Anaeramoeba flamelloides]|uniref:RIBOSOMAL RNA PROCESSING PROTEIN 1 n=1 Tax=Anaeramoeba flamelloides TaxID=1746091 RepID=A0ABQ8XKZ6_9EUKA|nr:RIBOSOMAL RNA PROCESSING PROTEIN 1 [Anaeramoeba flamelloides]
MSSSISSTELSSNDLSVREEALKKIIIQVCQVSKKKDFVQIWHTLFGSIWETKKKNTQQELVKSFTSLIHVLRTEKKKILFFESFLNNVIIELQSMNKYKLKKFKWVVKEQFNEFLLFLKKNGYNPKLIKTFRKLLKDKVFNQAIINKVGVEFAVYVCDILIDLLQMVWITDNNKKKNKDLKISKESFVPFLIKIDKQFVRLIENNKIHSNNRTMVIKLRDTYYRSITKLSPDYSKQASGKGKVCEVSLDRNKSQDKEEQDSKEMEKEKEKENRKRLKKKNRSKQRKKKRRLVNQFIVTDYVDNSATETETETEVETETETDTENEKYSNSGSEQVSDSSSKKQQETEKKTETETETETDTDKEYKPSEESESESESESPPEIDNVLNLKKAKNGRSKTEQNSENISPNDKKSTPQKQNLKNINDSKKETKKESIQTVEKKVTFNLKDNTYFEKKGIINFPTTPFPKPTRPILINKSDKIYVSKKKLLKYSPGDNQIGSKQFPQIPQNNGGGGGGGGRGRGRGRGKRGRGRGKNKGKGRGRNRNRGRGRGRGRRGRRRK